MIGFLFFFVVIAGWFLLVSLFATLTVSGEAKLQPSDPKHGGSYFALFFLYGFIIPLVLGSTIEHFVLQKKTY
jgi:hypothetical protein